jgi:hypothetical protein
MVKKLSEARPFGAGDGGGGDDDEDDYDRRGACGGDPKKYHNGTSCPVQESEEEEIFEDAAEGQHLYLGFLYNQVAQAGLTLPPGVFPPGILLSETEVELSPAQYPFS